MQIQSRTPASLMSRRSTTNRVGINKGDDTRRRPLKPGLPRRLESDTLSTGMLRLTDSKRRPNEIRVVPIARTRGRLSSTFPGLCWACLKVRNTNPSVVS
jgi:hypothetical protein